MLATSLVNGILKRGGTAELREMDRRPGQFEVVGELNGYDVHAYCQPKWDDPEGAQRQSCGHFTVRHQSKRDHYDPWSDYNPHGLTFVDRIAWLDTFCPPKATA